MPATDWGWLITPEELREWILEESEEVLVVNKPPHIVCHPSRHGPWSSLIGACREYLGSDVLRMPFRLDRETSGLMLFARTREAGSRLQRAVEARRVRKTYHAILCGCLAEPVTVTAALGRDENSEFFSRRAAVTEGESAETEFVPLASASGYTLVEVHPHTGRRHQIRVHAASIGLPIVGDKLYGDDPTIMLQFMREGFSPDLLARLPLKRHALHCSRVGFETERGVEEFAAPLPADMLEFAGMRLGAGFQSKN
jgi:23S rRNA pseudouridine1911/1915/1917 synthase